MKTLAYKEEGEKDADFLYRLALAYEKGSYVEKNKKKVIKFYEESAEKGNISAQIGLANCYYRMGMNREAFKWNKKAAEEGVKEAQFTLADDYERGIGTEKNLDLAFFGIVGKDNATARSYLVSFYQGGEMVEKDKQEVPNAKLEKVSSENSDIYCGFYLV